MDGLKMKYTNKYKIDNAKRFESLHKEPFYKPLKGIDEALNEAYLNLFDNCIMNELEGDESAGEVPYIELSKHETKCGQTVIFELS